MSHTPGPWRVFDALSGTEIVTDRSTARETESICSLKKGPNEKDNACLIIAAPDMAEALKNLLNYDFAAECEECGIGRSIEWQKARAALAKATGATTLSLQSRKESSPSE